MHSCVFVRVVSVFVRVVCAFVRVVCACMCVFVRVCICIHVRMRVSEERTSFIKDKKEPAIPMLSFSSIHIHSFLFACRRAASSALFLFTYIPFSSHARVLLVLSSYSHTF